MSEPHADRWPVVARWRQTCGAGTVTWHLGGLRRDRGFWGYAHDRTAAKRENRSFEGQVDATTLARVEQLIEQLDGLPTDDQTLTVVDGLIGIGTRSSFRRLVAVHGAKAQPDRPEALRLYHEFLELIQPFVAQAAKDRA